MTRVLAVLLALALAALAWQIHQRRAADTRADREATTAAVLRLRQMGWETAVAERDRAWTRRLDDSVAAVLRQARAQPITRTVVQATATGTTEARQDSVASGPDSTVYRISDPVLSGSVTVWVDSAVARVDWTAEIGLELVQAVGADGRLLSMVRADDERVVPRLRSVEWEPPRVPPGPSRLRWLLGGVAIGVIAWEIVR